MPRYRYDPALTHSENRRRAIALHEQSGPMVPVTRPDGWSEVTLGWLFPDGAWLPNEPEAAFEEPAAREDTQPQNLDWRDWGEMIGRTEERIRRYWQVREAQAVRKFNDLQELTHDHPTASTVAQLDMLHQEVEECRRKLAEVAPPPPEPAQRSAMANDERAELQAEILRMSSRVNS